jgi:HD-GYP domain-containing protein (c-di-GMP phosphodiesterase class II)
MTETQMLLGKISALRQRLEQAQGLANEAAGLAAAGRDHLTALGQQAAAGFEAAWQVDAVLRQLGDTTAAGSERGALPAQLTSRARRVLERGRDLLGRLRALGDEVVTAPGGAGSPPEPTDPLAVFYRDTTAMIDAALRLVQTFPEATSAQLRMCEGLEAVFHGVANRIARLTVAVRQRRLIRERIDLLATLLAGVYCGTDLDIKPFVDLAEALTDEAAQSAPLRFLYEPAGPGHVIKPERATACHSLTVAQVVARIARHDQEYRSRPVDAVLAALLHDVGMLGVPDEIFTQPGPLDEAQRRALEGHVRIGAGLAARLLPSGAWLADATAGHHERLDGTGYPDGLRELQLSGLTRLLAVCDVYAALGAPRPHRPARETRTALADTLLLAEQGALDGQQAERLLHLSFYPTGSVVELADGAVGVVVAPPRGWGDRAAAMQAPARPVVALLLDERGQPLASPQHLDLAVSESRSIVRTVPAPERGSLLGRSYPEYAA